MCHPAWRRARLAALRLQELARLRPVRDRMDREYARPLDVEALARAAGLPAGLLGREFRRAYGSSPYAYLMARRVERACVLLHRTDLGTAEVRRRVGCSSPRVFDRHFTARVGMSPDDYRRRTGGRPTAEVPAQGVRRGVRAG
ncbi:helix-turn-helix domain-containing protein [Streptomyces sp. NPDC059783]|uniref:helix-turn-helix domain-containing protein n=1 Tax=Streptomyces sp. NPDC059783 TaxID=3346944 RepID=UPI0036505CC2